jgi:hypothetical protein
MQLECKYKPAENLTVKGLRKISVKELRALGYKLSDKQIPLGQKPYKYGILEVKNEDNGKEIGFSLLYSTADKLGVILPNPYNYYVLRPSSCLAILR